MVAKVWTLKKNASRKAIERLAGAQVAHRTGSAGDEAEGEDGVTGQVEEDDKKKEARPGESQKAPVEARRVVGTPALLGRVEAAVPVEEP